MNNLALIEHAEAIRGRVLDLPPHYLDRLADALAIAPAGETRYAGAQLLAERVEAEHYRLTAADTRGIRTPRKARP